MPVPLQSLIPQGHSGPEWPVSPVFQEKQKSGCELRGRGEIPVCILATNNILNSMHTEQNPFADCVQDSCLQPLLDSVFDLLAPK